MNDLAHNDTFNSISSTMFMVGSIFLPFVMLILSITQVVLLAKIAARLRRNP